MNGGPYLGPNFRGACPAPLNPQSRKILGWLPFQEITQNSTFQADYNLRDPKVFQIRNSTNSGNYWLIETRNFNATMTIGSTVTNDYNYYLLRGYYPNAPNQGVLVWRITSPTSHYATVLHANGQSWPDYPRISPGDPFPGTGNVKLLSPSTDIRTSPNWVPNTKPSTNVAMQVIGEGTGYYSLNLYYNYQQALLDLASQNQSLSSDATGKNNGRRLVKDGSGNYHLVFASDGEIFYRKNLGGTSWQTPVRLSSSNGNNNYPSVALGNSNSVLITWQRQTGTQTYDINFAMSTDGGSTWSTSYKYTLATSVSSSIDPTPVISVNPYYYRKTILYSSSAGLISKTTTAGTPLQSDWATQNVTTSSYDQLPTLATSGNSIYQLQANQNTSDNHVYYRYQDGYGNWSSTTNLSSIVPGTAVNQTPSITGIPSSAEIHVAWRKLTNGGATPYDHIIVHRRANSYNDWRNEYFTTYYQGQQLPSISGLAANKVDLLFQGIPSQSNSVYKMRFDGSYWNAPTLLAENSYYPSVSIGSTTSKYVYTNGIFSPYTVTFSSETLSKETEFNPQVYSRSIAIMNNPEEYLEVVLNKMYFKMKDGSKQRIDFETVSLDTFKLSTENAFDLMKSIKDLTIPVGADELVFDYKIRSENLEKVIEDNSNKVNLSFDLDIPSKSIKSNKQNLVDVIGGKIKETKQEIGIPLNSLNAERGYDKIKISMKLNGLIAKKTAFASLGHIFDFNRLVDNKELPKEQGAKTSSKAPTNFELQNYPNPFNPTTKISFSIPQKSQIKLKVFDVLGREVANLADGVYEAGKYEVTFDASSANGGLPSGVYFYNLTTASGSISKKMLLLK